MDEVERVLNEYGSEGVESWSLEPGEVGPACDNCGNIAGPVLPTICPTCSFRNISACPYCNHEVARQSYVPISGDLFTCPECERRVRLRFNDPLFNSSGYYNQPLVLVERAEDAGQ